MTESDWLTCTDPMLMLQHVWQTVSDRKVLLFASACCRRNWHLLDKICRNVVEIVDLFADGDASEQELKTAQEAIDSLPSDVRYTEAVTWFTDKVLGRLVVMVTGNAACDAASASCPVRGRLRTAAWEKAKAAEIKEQAAVFRDILVNPFRPSTPLPDAVLAWNDSTVRHIAEGIYNIRRLPEGTQDNGRLAILATALLDAGCNNEELIAHCRTEGPHVRGCWALDLILGKE